MCRHYCNAVRVSHWRSRQGSTGNCVPSVPGSLLPSAIEVYLDPLTLKRIFVGNDHFVKVYVNTMFSFKEFYSTAKPIPLRPWKAD